MGIPSLYNWLAVKYPSILVEATSIGSCNVYDNVYLDITAIIYEVLHPVDRDSPVTIDQVFQRLYDYMDVIFTMAPPRKLVYMAIDGVAPRAKMNQQRSRRFRAAKANADAAVEETKLRDEFHKAGKRLPSKNYMGVYFSHLVAPGTSFMVSLSDALKKYATHKLNNDPNWKNMKVIVSDANVSGEGEHKIMSFIRQQKNSVGYDANASHCVYGSDTDLIMLGLASHEYQFSILRNVVFSYRKGEKVIGDYNEFGERMKNKNAYEFLNLWKFQEFFRREITTPNSKFENDFDRRIDDFVFMCFFLGNDFLPNIPSLDINEGAIDLMLSVYKEVVDSGEYLTESCKPNLKSFEKFIQALGSYEDHTFKMRSIVYKSQIKESMRAKRFGRPSYSNVSVRPFFLNRSMDVSKSEMYENKNELKKQLKSLLFKKSDTFDPEYNRLEEDKIRLEETGWKERYYKEKFSAKTVNEIEVVKKTTVTKYVEGLCWIMHYYYKGVASWKWHYPYYYAPFASDFKDIGRQIISYEIGAPLKPFTHMLGISSPLAHVLYLPKEYRKLITDPNSPIKDFYPTVYEIDINGKRHTCDAIIKLPFVDEQRLIEAVANIENTLTADEILLNSTTSEVLLESSIKTSY